MKIRCVHGYFFFEEEKPGELSTFSSATGFDLVPCDSYFTFSKLQLAPEYSFRGLKYIDTIADETYAGKPWDVMRENAFVYDFVAKLVRPIAHVTAPLSLFAAPDYFFSDFLILPGSRASGGKRVTGYSGFGRADGTKFRYTEVGYDETI